MANATGACRETGANIEVTGGGNAERGRESERKERTNLHDRSFSLWTRRDAAAEASARVDREKKKRRGKKGRRNTE